MTASSSDGDPRLRCIPCGAVGLVAVAEQVDRRKGLPGRWHLFECRGCGAISIAPLPSTDELSAYYASYSSDRHVELSRGAGSRFPRLRKIFHAISGDVDPRDFIEVSEGVRVLDYGCGHAGYLIDFQARGVRMSGAEIAPYVVEACKAQGFDVRKVDDSSRIPFLDGEFDVAYLMQVFEHLRDPHGFLRELNRVLKPGGLLYLALPNKNSVWRRIFGKNWISGWFAPFHLFLHDKKSLETLAKQYGFATAASWSRTPEFWFRMNLKAALYPEEDRLDLRSSWLDVRLVRYALMILLRILELPVRERDCLIMRLAKRGQ